MKRVLSLLPFLSLILGPMALPAAAANAPQGAAKSVQPSPAAVAPLSNADVLKMHEARVAPEVVVAKIRSSAASFDTSPEALRALKEAGVADAVVLAMVESPRGADGAARAAANRPAELSLPAGTIVDVEAAYEINSQLVRTGDALSFRVVYPVKVNGVTVIEAGSTATGRVEVAKRGGHWGKAGTLVWSLQYVTAVDGTRVPLQFATMRQRGDSKGAKVATQVALTGAVFWFAPPVALLHGFKRGGNAVIPAGKRFEAFVSGDAKVRAYAVR